MKKSICILMGCVLTVIVICQTPNAFKYQAILRDQSGNTLVNKQVSMRISIIQTSPTGNVLYSEVFHPTSNSYGLVILEIGNGQAETGSFNLISWSQGLCFLKVELDPNNGTNYINMGTTQILSVPYALQAKTAETYTETDPVWVTSQNNYYTKINLQTEGQGQVHWNNITSKPSSFSGSFADLTSKPTTLAGYGITDAMNTSHSANKITQDSITNWNKAYGWGNHSTAGYLKTETDPVWIVASSNYYTKINLQTSGQALVHWNNLSNIPSNLDDNKTDDVNLTGDQTIAGNKTFSNTLVANNGISVNNKTINNLADPINNQDAATKAYVNTLMTQLSQKGVVAIDADGNIYSTVRIGSQVWMAENLKTTHYSEGTAIPNITNGATWLGLTTGAYCIYENNASLVSTYGLLYNWHTVNTGKLCPTSWHVPSDAEWTTLEIYLGGSSTAGGKLKETGTTHWWDPNTGATNESGFTALPGGYRHTGDGFFYQISIAGYCWNSSEYDTNNALLRYMTYESLEINKGNAPKTFGSSVRCIKNQ